jgi:hypothetical protein
VPCLLASAGLVVLGWPKGGRGRAEGYNNLLKMDLSDNFMLTGTLPDMKWVPSCGVFFQCFKNLCHADEMPGSTIVVHADWHTARHEVGANVRWVSSFKGFSTRAVLMRGQDH